MDGNWGSLLLSWVPFVGIVLAYILCVRFSRQRTAAGLTIIDLYELQIVEMRRTNTTLEKIAAALDKRS
ncbi:MAG TPA: hypothetical protein VGG01_11960 [Xanthobacteraceae bacterium]